MHILVELSAGYALFERIQSEEIGQEQVQKSITELPRFQKVVKLVSFLPFKSAAHALENCMDVSEGVVNPHLKGFLEVNLAKSKNTVLGVGDSNLGGGIKATSGIECQVNDVVKEIIRGIRLHSAALLGKLSETDLNRSQLGLGHAYSRSKVKFNVNRVDNMITQSIALLDQIDKDINTFSMRVREWYGWHFPELVKIVSDNQMYAQVAKFVKNKSNLGPEQLDDLESIVADPIKAKQILDASRASMGTDISAVDMVNIESFADRVISLSEYRKSLYNYLCNKMHAVAPNVSALIGEIVGARLIAQAGSLTNLAKYPASTLQILGAEKALFRALKTKSNTPKYGLIYHSTFIGRAAQKNKGRISRVLANKVSIAARIDCFMENPTSQFGEILRDQVEERLKFYEDGTIPRKNADAMAEALAKAGLDIDIEEDEGDEMEVDEETEPKKRKVEPEEKADKKKKKKKKAKEDESPEKPKDKKKKDDKESSPEKPLKEKKKKKSKKSE